MATELGKAYVQIVPSARGLSGAIQGQLDPEADAAGRSAGSRIGTGLKVAAAAAVAATGVALGKIISSSLTEGANLQQSLGGIETLFKGSADKVIKYADMAYKTAGLSANDYMESVTSFSASLLQSMGGDTEAAADKANMALIDMSDNANKMGTNMQDIQNAYQGFAKQNYTMLDNLKLGYGGTKTEMERLLADAEKLTGVKYNIDNLADVYDAIHAIQEELDITGTTAKEAAETFSGSFTAMKSAFSNVLGNLSLGRDITPSLEALAETTSTFLVGNLIPMVVNILKALPGAIATFIKASIPYIKSAFNDLIESISSTFPIFGKFVDFIEKNAQVIKMLGSVILGMIASFVAFKTITTVLTSVKTAITGVKAAFVAMKAAMLTNPFTLLIVAVGALAGAFVYFYKTSEGFRNVVNNIGDSISNMIKSFTGLDSISDFFFSIKVAWMGLMDVLKGDIVNIDQLKASFAGWVPDSVAEKIMTIGDTVFKLKLAWQGLLGVMKGEIKGLKDLEAFFSGWISKDIAKMILNVANSFKNLINPTKQAGKNIDVLGIAFKILKSIFLAFLGPIGLAIKAFELVAKVLGGGDINKGIDTILSSFDGLATGIQKNAPLLGSSFGKALEGILKAIGKALPGIISGGLQIIAGLISGIAQGIPMIALAAAQLIAAFTGALLVLVPTVILSATSIIVAFLGALTAALPQIIVAGAALIVALLQGISEQLPSLIASAANLIITWLTALNEHLPDILQAGFNLLLTFLQGIADNIGQVSQQALNIILNFAQVILENMPTIVNTAVDLMVNFASSLASRMPDIIAAATMLIANFVNGIANNIDSIIASAVNLIVNFLEGIANRIDDIVNAGMNLVDSLVQGAINAQDRLMNAAINLINGFAENIRGRQGDVRNAALNLLDAIIGVFVPDSLFNVGKDLIGGLLGGIGSMAKSVYDKVSEIAGNIKNTITGLFDINSPSRWMRDMVGKNMMLGWGIGIEKNSNFTTNALKEAVNTVQDIVNSDIDTNLLSSNLDDFNKMLPQNDLDIQKNIMHDISKGYDRSDVYPISKATEKQPLEIKVPVYLYPGATKEIGYATAPHVLEANKNRGYIVNAVRGGE